jgi:hypothetical protein
MMNVDKCDKDDILAFGVTIRYSYKDVILLRLKVECLVRHKKALNM